MTASTEIDTEVFSQMLTGSDMIGRTYNVHTGQIARTTSLLPYQLFNITEAGTKSVYVYNIEYSVPTELICTPINETSVRETFTETHTATQTENNFGIELGVSGVSGTFSGELNISYAQQTSTSVSASYYTTTVSSSISSYRLEIQPDRYRTLLKPDVAAEIDTMEANALVAKYGTHFLRSALFGGTWNFTQSISTAAASSKVDAQLTVKANYNGVSGEINNENSVYSSESSTQTFAEFEAVGGDNRSVNGGLNDWASSVPGNFAMFAFDSNRANFASLQPLSMLAVTYARKTQIESAIRSALTQQFSLYDVVWDASKIEYWFCDYHGTRAKTDRLAQGEKTVSIKNNLNQVIVGIGLSIDDSNVSDLGIKVLDLSTSQTSWIDANGRAIAGQPESYEKIVDLMTLNQNAAGQIVDLCIAVGVSASASTQACDGLGLFYQTLSMTSAATKYLVGDIKFENQGGSEVAFRPDTSARTILLGVSARAQDGILKNLWVKTAPMKSVTH